MSWKLKIKILKFKNRQQFNYKNKNPKKMQKKNKLYKN